MYNIEITLCIHFIKHFVPNEMCMKKVILIDFDVHC